MKENEPLIILIVVIVIAGFIYGPIKNKSLSKPEQATAPTRNLEYSNNKDVLDKIKETEKDINDIKEKIDDEISKSKRSPYYGKVYLSNISNLNDPEPNREYMKLSTNLDDKEILTITGWYLKSEITGKYVIIGGASLLPFPFKKTESPIKIQDGDSVYLTKGFSPIGISFRTNKCTGYFEENREFTPNLPMQCPTARNEKLPTFSNIEDRNQECLDILYSIPRCSTRGSAFTRNFADTVPQSCKTYIETQINYESCVAKHFGDTDFPGNEYRVYFNKFGPLWQKNNDTINLYDENGLIIDTIKY